MNFDTDLIYILYLLSPVCAAFWPGHLWSERGEDVVDAVGQDHVVVDGHDDGDHALANAHTVAQGKHVPDLDWTSL